MRGATLGLLGGVKLFLLDLDGVLLVGKDRPRLLGGVKLLEQIRCKEKSFFILTNNTTDTRAEIREKLGALGLEVREEEILSAAYLTAKYLRDRFSSCACYLLGESGFAQELRAFGHDLVAKGADAVVVGIDRGLSYEKLDGALQELRRGARLIASHRARLYMDEGGPRLAPGAIVKGLEYASKKKALAIGKPAPLMFKMALAIKGCPPQEALMIGDQLETDVKGAQRLGIRTALVMSGLEDERSLAKATIKPDLVLRCVDDLLKYL